MAHCGGAVNVPDPKMHGKLSGVLGGRDAEGGEDCIL